MDKDQGAFLTIGELARELGVAQHILRYWETRFPQLRPLQRTGNRRYYRPRDVEIAREINKLLNEEGFTVRGAQRLMAQGAGKKRASAATHPAPSDAAGPAAPTAAPPADSATGAQGELPIGGAPAVSAPTREPGPRGSRQIGASDLALLIARLTVIRENLRDALGED